MILKCRNILFRERHSSRFLFPKKCTTCATWISNEVVLTYDMQLQTDLGIGPSQMVRPFPPRPWAGPEFPHMIPWAGVSTLKSHPKQLRRPELRFSFLVPSENLPRKWNPLKLPVGNHRWQGEIPINGGCHGKMLWKIWKEFCPLPCLIARG
jgi:hypothetical protein